MSNPARKNSGRGQDSKKRARRRAKEIDIEAFLPRLMTGPKGYYTDADGYTIIVKAYAMESTRSLSMSSRRRHAPMMRWRQPERRSSAPSSGLI
jgi:hypothetical protein